MRRLALVLLATACTPPGEAVPVFDPGSSSFFDAPWPADARTTDDGHPDWSTFPNPTGLTLFERFLDTASDRPGFAHNSPAFLRLLDLDTRTLPEPAESVDPTSGLQIIDITPDSPEFGERIPLQWEHIPDPGAYVPGDLLAVAPIPGWPLRARTTYALVLTTAVAQADEAFAELLRGGEGAWADDAALLAAALPDVDVPLSRVALASAFTTGDPTADLDAVARFLDERVEPPTFTPELVLVDDVGPFKTYRTDYTTPLFMEGDKPYAETGGAWRFRDDGLPVVQAWDLMRMSVVMPEPLPPEPDGGFPVVVFLDGTGGDYRSFARSDSEFDFGRWITDAGAIAVGIDLPLHGVRATSDTVINLHSFNVLQPDSALQMHRQAAADTLYLLKGLTDQTPSWALPGGGTVTLDPDRVVLMGHSQGGITSALALPWVGDRVGGVMLSGAGGLLAITAMEREADFDFPELIRSLLEFADDEPLSALHPVLGVIQAIVDRTDPINYASAWFHEDRGLHGATPTPVFLTSGMDDTYTPTETAEALAAAARMPFAGKQVGQAPGLVLRGERGQGLPIGAVTPALDGTDVTAGFAQWSGEGHFVVHGNTNARDMARNFLLSALDGDPVIRRGAP